MPALGYETDDGEVIDLAWAEVRVGVKFDTTIGADGWTSARQTFRRSWRR